MTIIGNIYRPFVLKNGLNYDELLEGQLRVLDAFSDDLSVPTPTQRTESHVDRLEAKLLQVLDGRPCDECGVPMDAEALATAEPGPGGTPLHAECSAKLHAYLDALHDAGAVFDYIGPKYAKIYGPDFTTGLELARREVAVAKLVHELLDVAHEAAERRGERHTPPTLFN